MSIEAGVVLDSQLASAGDCGYTAFGEPASALLMCWLSVSIWWGQ